MNQTTRVISHQILHVWIYFQEYISIEHLSRCATFLLLSLKHDVLIKKTIVYGSVTYTLKNEKLHILKGEGAYYDVNHSNFCKLINVAGHEDLVPKEKTN